MALCDKCGHEISEFLPKEYDTATTAEKIFHLKQALGTLESEHKLYRESSDTASMLATEKQIASARDELKKLEEGYEPEERELDAIVLDRHLADKEKELEVVKDELAFHRNDLKQIQNGEMSATQDDIASIDAQVLNCHRRIETLKAEIKSLEDKLEAM